MLYTAPDSCLEPCHPLYVATAIQIAMLLILVLSLVILHMLLKSVWVYLSQDHAE